MNSPEVILADDDASVAFVVEMMLQDAGYKVSLASSGAAAMDALDMSDAPPGALVTDIRLGAGASGWDVAVHARRRWPKIGVVYISGDSAADWPSRGVPGSTIIRKPCAAAQLLQAVACAA